MASIPIYFNKHLRCTDFDIISNMVGDTWYIVYINFFIIFVRTHILIYGVLMLIVKSGIQRYFDDSVYILKYGCDCLSGLGGYDDVL